jgi:cobalt-zinc-cadmium resistance protein CzcA
VFRFLFSGGQKARIEAAKVAQSVAENELKNAEFNLRISLKSQEIYQQSGNCFPL